MAFDFRFSVEKSAVFRIRHPIRFSYLSARMRIRVKRAMNTMILMQARKILMKAVARKTKASIAIRSAQLKRRSRDVHLFSL